MAHRLGIYSMLLTSFCFLPTTGLRHNGRVVMSDEVLDRLSSTCHHSDLTLYLRWIADAHSEIARLVPIGNSTEGRELWTIIITENPNERPLLKPKVKFIGNINGHSGPGCVLLLKLIRFLVEQYDSDEELRHLMSQVEVHFLPNLNPDGYVRSQPGNCSKEVRRGNANGVDLNRNFPDMFHPLDDNEDDPELQPETVAVIEWMKKNSFVVSTSYFSGAQIVIYPYDSAPDNHRLGEPHETPDAKTFEYLAVNYIGFVNQDPTSHWFCSLDKWRFPEGLANGAQLGRVSGTMMDYNYNNGVFELFVGMTCCLNENNAGELDEIWQRHKYAMISTIRQAEFSFRGRVVDTETGQPMGGVELIVIPPEALGSPDDMNNAQMPFFTNEHGEFFRILLSGQYLLKVFLKGYETQTIPIDVNADGDIPPEVMHITMVSLSRNRRLRLQRPPLADITPPHPDYPTGSYHHHHTGERRLDGYALENTQIDIHEEIRNYNLVVENPRMNFSTSNNGVFHELEGYPKATVTEYGGGQSGLRSVLIDTLFLTVLLSLIAALS